MAKSTARSTSAAYDRFDTSALLLDSDNPRLQEYSISPKASQADILRAIWQRMAAEEVAMSIAYNGYFNHEPLFIEKRSDGQLVVIEGNRRLCAVKILLDAKLRTSLKATALPTLSATRRKELSSLPGIITTRKDVWRYLGFKHVNGAATWGAYAKAQYVAKVHNEYGVPLEDIAKQIGDYSNTIERQYHGLMVVEQAEESGVFDRLNVARSRFEFSHIYTGLSHEGIRAFLGLRAESRTKRRPVQKLKTKNLGELLEWIYGNRARGIQPRMRTQAEDLRKLSAILMDPGGIKALRNGLPLDSAQDIILGDKQLFLQALYNAKASLQSAHGTLSTGYSPKEVDALKIAAHVEELAIDLVDEMRRKQTRQRSTTQSAKRRPRRA